MNNVFLHRRVVKFLDEVEEKKKSTGKISLDKS